MVNKADGKIVCTTFEKGRCHDFRLFCESKTGVHRATQVVADSGYQGIESIHPESRIPKKKPRGKSLGKAEKQLNRSLAQERILNEHVIGKLKRFRIIADRYRNRRKRFRLRFNLIAGIYNFEINS